MASLMTDLFVNLVADSLTEDVYNASLAGLTYEIESTMLGINICTDGYSDRQHILLELVLRRLKSLEIKEERLVILKEEVR